MNNATTTEKDWESICLKDESLLKYWNAGDVENYEARLKELGQSYNYNVKVTGES